ncbi:hypothetical protein FHX06_000645 [Rhizobium sp. BK512]|uniref:hypothetical protein n=1 Tax=Rhizobium sp. BK512 TaxID=2587010 RepID=UPI00160BF097|nr:hypothetical protein [Rhizobium sp. BK512]MBB3559348.1 hypothetical protein [Rhizobium sp. BK512]
MTLSKRIKELEDDQLEEFIDIWAERKSKDYVKVERLGQANDKGRDVVGFVTSARHEGEWDLFNKSRDHDATRPRVLLPIENPVETIRKVVLALSIGLTNWY